MKERVRGVIVYKHKLIVLKRTWGNSEYFVFPGGGVEKGENHTQALIRECQEELGVQVKVGKLLAVNTFRGAKEFFYFCVYVSGKFGTGDGPEYSRPESYNGTHSVASLAAKDFARSILFPGHIADKVAHEVFHARDAEPTGILKKLRGGDLRSTGRADEVAKKILNDRSLFDEVFSGVHEKDRVVRARAFDACEKAAAKNPALLDRHRAELLVLAKSEKQQEVKWHVAQMIGHVWWENSESKKLATELSKWVHDATEKSAIVRTFALQTIYFLAKQNPGLTKLLKKELAFTAQHGTPAMKARGRNIEKERRKS